MELMRGTYRTAPSIPGLPTPGIEGAFLVWGLGGVGCLTLSSALLYKVCMNTKTAYKSHRNVYYSCKYHVVWCLSQVLAQGAR